MILIMCQDRKKYYLCNDFNLKNTNNHHTHTKKYIVSCFYCYLKYLKKRFWESY